MINNKIFFSKSEIVYFSSKLKDFVDTILNFVKHDIYIIPPVKHTNLLMQDHTPTHKEWLLRAPKMTIVDIVTSIIANEEGKKNAKSGIKNIFIDNVNKTIKIDYQDVDSSHIDIIKQLLEKLLFDYYDQKVIDTRLARTENLKIANQSKTEIFGKINKATRHTRK